MYKRRITGNNKIKNFLILGFLGNLILIILITLISYIGISKVNNNFDDYHKHEKIVLNYMDATNALYYIEIKLNTLHKYSKQHILTTNPVELNNIKTQIDFLENDIRNKSQLYSKLAKKLNPHKNFSPDFINSFDNFINMNNQVLNLSQQNKKKSAIQLSLLNTFNAYLKSENLLEQKIKSNLKKSLHEQKIILNFYNDTKKVISSTISYILVLGILCTWASILLALTTIYIITDSFKKLIKKENELQEQNLILKNLLEKEQVLRHINISIRQSLNLNEVLQSIIDELAQYFKADICFVLEYDKQNSILKPFHYQYLSEGTELTNNHFFINQLCTLTEKLKDLKDITFIENVCDFFKDSKIQHKFCDISNNSVLFVPIIYQNSLSSIIGLIRKNNGTWSKEEISTLPILTDQFAIALEQSLLFEKLKKLNSILLLKEQELKDRNISLIKIMEDLEYANRELIIINKTLRELDEMKTNFIATVSHELRTPLTSIKGSLGLIISGMAGEYNPEIGDFLNVCYRNTDRLVRLINELLDIAKIESGSINMDKMNFELQDLVKESLEGIHSFAKEKNVLLKNNLNESLNVYADKNRIGQVMYNLLSNAIKFSSIVENREPTVEVDVYKYNDDIAICIKDNGIGIPLDKQSNIFDKFTQVDNSSTRNINGTGLGLAISKAIIEEHDGVIWVESTENIGTKVIFTIGNKVKQLNSTKQKNRLLLNKEDEPIIHYNI